MPNPTGTENWHKNCLHTFFSSDTETLTEGPPILERFKNILVATDTRFDSHPIVDEAVEIAVPQRRVYSRSWTWFPSFRGPFG